jgi:hypothetical protein
MLLSLVRRRAVAFVVALLAALALVFALWPTTAGATASNQVKAPNDAKISQANPDTPSGQDPTIRVSGSSSVGLFKFTTASLSTPAGATINEVFVQMFLDPTSTAVDGHELRLYESTCFTSEDTVTWNTRPTRLDLLATRDVFNQSGTLRPSVTFSYTDLTALNTGSPTCFGSSPPTRRPPSRLSPMRTATRPSRPSCGWTTAPAAPRPRPSRRPAAPRSWPPGTCATRTCRCRPTTRPARVLPTSSPPTTPSGGSRSATSPTRATPRTSTTTRPSTTT